MVGKKLKEQEGSIVVESSIGIFVACIAMVLIIQTVSILIYRYQMGTVADKITEMISVTGKYDSEEEKIVKEYLKKSTNLKNATISLTGTKFIGDTKKIQLDSPIKVTVKAEYKIGFSFARFQIPLVNVSQARSNVYWKK